MYETICETWTYHSKMSNQMIKESCLCINKINKCLCTLCRCNCLHLQCRRQLIITDKYGRFKLLASTRREVNIHLLDFHSPLCIQCVPTGDVMRKRSYTTISYDQLNFDIQVEWSIFEQYIRAGHGIFHELWFSRSNRIHSGLWSSSHFL